LETGLLLVKLLDQLILVHFLFLFDLLKVARPQLLGVVVLLQLPLPLLLPLFDLVHQVVVLILFFLILSFFLQMHDFLNNDGLVDDGVVVDDLLQLRDRGLLLLDLRLLLLLAHLVGRFLLLALLKQEG
jgi:hypothetical protein